VYTPPRPSLPPSPPGGGLGLPMNENSGQPLSPADLPQNAKLNLLASAPGT
jgi:hypothetical protein